MNPLLFHWRLSLVHPLRVEEQILPPGFVNPVIDMHSAVHLGILLEGDLLSAQGLSVENFLTASWQLHGRVSSRGGAKLILFTFLPEAVMNCAVGEDRETVHRLLCTPLARIHARLHSPEIKAAARELTDCRKMFGSRYDAAVSERKTWLRLVDFLCDTARFLHHDEEAEIGKKFRKIAPVFELLASCRQFPLSPALAAKSCCLSESYFHHLFKECMGISFSNYELCFRLNGASADLAAGTGAGIKEIALDWGFCDTSHFSNVFKRHFGVSPSQYRS